MKFPVNSIEISFIAGAVAAILYIGVSLLTCREPFDLERLLHRGKWADPDDPRNAAEKAAPRKRSVLGHLIGITPEFTREDRFIAWLGFFKHMVWDWVLAFLVCSIVAKIFHWGVREWSIRCFVVVLVVPITINIATTVWFTWGTVRDLRRLFHDLAVRVRNDLDNGMVEGHVSLADRSAFAERDAKDPPRPSKPRG